MKQRGFTLIELLVVISIMGLLSSVVLVALQGAREKGRIASLITFERHTYGVLSDKVLADYQFDDNAAWNCPSGKLKTMTNSASPSSLNLVISIPLLNCATVLQSATATGKGTALNVSLLVNNSQSSSSPAIRVPDFSNFSAGFWIQFPTSVTGSDTIPRDITISLFDSTGLNSVGSAAIDITPSSGINFIGQGSTNLITPAQLTDNKWHYVFLSVTGNGANNLALYFDGRKAGVLSAGTWLTAATASSIVVTVQSANSYTDNIYLDHLVLFGDSVK